MGNEPEEVTAAVTPRELTPWEHARMTKEEWDALEIPEFLRRSQDPSDQVCPIPTTTTHATAPAKEQDITPEFAVVGSHAVDGSAGTPSGQIDDWQKFRTVTPDDIETQIRREADRRYRDWTPTKEQPKRPRKSWFERKVRKEFYP